MKLALGVEYNGHGFHGWQIQDNLITVQGCIEEALQKIADAPIQIFCAGRTDAGVHATGQVIHFETDVKRDLRAWILGTNRHLPDAIAIRWVREVDEHFHARFSAESRRYRYIIYNHSSRPALFAHRATWYHYPLDINRMQQAANYLLGEHDFTSFRSSACQSHSPVRTVLDVQVKRQDDFVIFEIEANAFLHHMVRNLSGALMRIGSHFQEPDWIPTLIEAKDRRLAAEKADPDGLYLCNVMYPIQYSFPKACSIP